MDMMMMDSNRTKKIFFGFKQTDLLVFSKKAKDLKRESTYTHTIYIEKLKLQRKCIENNMKSKKDSTLIL